MKYIRKRNNYLLKESNELNSVKTNRGSTSVIVDLCVCMLLINPNFLDNLLDKGIRGRYENNSSVFLNDLKNLLFGRNRLKVGKYEGDLCVEDPDSNRINSYFNECSNDFSIEEDWNKLIGARNLARNIQDKLFFDQKLSEEMIEAVYWLGPNKTDEHTEDLVIEIGGKIQYSININKKINLSKSQSFNTVLETLFDNTDGLYSDEMLVQWDKLTREWCRIIYNFSKPNIKAHIKKYIDPERFESLTYYGYFDVKHMNPDVAILGENIPELGKNILEFSDLMTNIWKNKETCLDKIEEATKDWNEKKAFIMNSKIIEYYISNQFKNLSLEKPVKNGNFTNADGKIKMKLAKLIMDIIGSEEKDIYYFTSTGNMFYKIPERQFFRDNYDSIKIEYDIHTELTPNDEEDANDSNFKLNFILDDEKIISIDMYTKFSGGEMSGRLSTKYKINFVSDFNYQIYKKLST